MAEIKEHPILFNGEMVRAILDRRKTQTRRVITPRTSFLDGRPWDKLYKVAKPDWDNAWVDPGPSPAGNPGSYLHLPFPELGTTHRIYPRVQVGDNLWVRETLRKFNREPFPTAQHLATATAVPYVNGAKRGYVGRAGWEWKRDTLPSIHMPRWASRITLGVKDVRAERLHEITVGDLIAEGIIRLENAHIETYPLDLIVNRSEHYTIWRKVWDSINAKRGYPFDDNPWVFAYEFKYLGKMNHRGNN